MTSLVIKYHYYMNQQIMPSDQIKKAYADCLQQARSHYENFPTASRLIDKQHRDATAAIYSFARRADDFADEGDLDNATRLARLDEFRSNLNAIDNNQPIDDSTFIALADTVTRYKLPLTPLQDLLHAFSMDVEKKRFADFNEILYYCRHSANPIGELVLRIHGAYNANTAALADKICSALQIINFMQDIDADYHQRNRIYIPQDEMQQYSVQESDLAARNNSPALNDLVAMQLERAKNMLLQGAPLVAQLRGRLKWVIKFTVNGGLMICKKCQQRNNVFQRPVLTKKDTLALLARSMYFRT